MNIHECQITNNPASKWLNTVKDNIQANKLNISPDFLTSQTVAGTQLSLPSKYKYQQNWMDYAEEYDPTANYSPGDVIRVLPNKNYELSAYLTMSNVQTQTDPVTGPRYDTPCFLPLIFVAQCLP